ncbi:unnamed protein product [Paramecium sonneborni]|uniref:Protein kinase domain-containing protein n=1 Tax=Paramecium sonneborni TaxID=65129 RepID=A0A8S1R6M0_9CILI|nr:unnamed protein product [Paramecium sonneborni]
MISKQQNLKSRKLQLFDFEVKEIIESSTKRYQMGFSYELIPRAEDYFKPYLEQKDDDLYSFQLKRDPNIQNQGQINKQMKQFIPLEYVDGKFLNELEKISSETFIEIFFQLTKALFELHKKNILARCISSKNIFLNQFQIKIYLLEFGFYPEYQFENQYKPEYDVILLIRIMNELNQIPKSNETKKIGQLMTKIKALEGSLSNLDTIQIYHRLYELVEGGPTLKEIKELYTNEWVNIMNLKIHLTDFQSLIKVNMIDSDKEEEQIEQEEEIEELEPPYSMNRFEFVKKALEIFENNFSQEISQIGLMLTLLNYLIEQMQIKNQQGLVDEICQRQIQILDKMKIEMADEQLQPFIEPQTLKIISLKDFLKLYRIKTYETYKRLFRNKQNFENQQKQDQLKFLKIQFMMVATLKINSSDFNEEEFSNLFNTKVKKDIQNKIDEILNSFYRNKVKA